MAQKKYDEDIVGWYTRGGKRVPIRKTQHQKKAEKDLSSGVNWEKRGYWATDEEEHARIGNKMYSIEPRIGTETWNLMQKIGYTIKQDGKVLDFADDMEKAKAKAEEYASGKKKKRR